MLTYISIVALPARDKEKEAILVINYMIHDIMVIIKQQTCLSQRPL